MLRHRSELDNREPASVVCRHNMVASQYVSRIRNCNGFLFELKDSFRCSVCGFDPERYETIARQRKSLLEKAEQYYAQITVITEPNPFDPQCPKYVAVRRVSDGDLSLSVYRHPNGSYVGFYAED
jgi:hypothetical protein